MTRKSEKYLQDLIGSDDYEEEAKQAAVWELERRGVKSKGGLNEKTYTQAILRNKAGLPPIRLILIGIVFITLAIHWFRPTLVAPQSPLVPVEGTIESYNFIIENISAKNEFGIIPKGKIAVLSFFINENNRKYELIENIGEENDHEEFERLSMLLNNSKSVRIWIEESKQPFWKPRIFKLDIDGINEYEFVPTPTDPGLAFVFLIILGITSISMAFLLHYLKRRNSIEVMKFFHH